MSSRSLAHLSDGTLRRQIASLVATDRTTTAHLLHHLAEFEKRRLFAQDGFPSMFAYCVHRLGFSEDMAFKRIRVARAARRFPALLDAIAEGRVHLTGAVFLAPCLSAENAEELLAAATHKTKAEIELLLAQRFPRPDLPSLIHAIRTPVPTPARPVDQGVSGQSQGEGPAGARSLASDGPGAPPAMPASRYNQVVPEPPPALTAPARVAPLAPRRFALQATISQDTHDKLRRLQDLLGPQIPSGDLAQVLDRAFDALIEKLEKAKCAATHRPRRHPTGLSADPRHIPAHVKRQVWERDGGRCTFVSENGQRCSGRKFLEYDHVQEVARGGPASVGNLRLRCRAHNQLTAERTFGPGFMSARREAARLRPRETEAGEIARMPDGSL